LIAKNKMFDYIYNYNIMDPNTMPVPTTTTEPSTQLSESIRVMSNALNIACKAGTYNLNEAYFIKQSISHIERLQDPNWVNDTINMNELVASNKLIHMSLNTAAKNGVYNMDESFIIKLSMLNIEKIINNINQ